MYIISTNYNFINSICMHMDVCVCTVCVHWQSQQTEDLLSFWFFCASCERFIIASDLKNKTKQLASDRPGCWPVELLGSCAAMGRGVCQNALWCPSMWKCIFAYFSRAAGKAMAAAKAAGDPQTDSRLQSPAIRLQTGCDSKVHARVISSGTDWKTVSQSCSYSYRHATLNEGVGSWSHAQSMGCERGEGKEAWLCNGRSSIYN